MNYKCVTIKTDNSAKREILIALLSEIGYDGFEEQEEYFLAYIEEEMYDLTSLSSVVQDYEVSFEVTEIVKTNWNKQWEENFAPVIVEDFCTVRADFHKFEITTPYEIVITPKMSFGTGHHSTTRLMMQAMKEIAFEDKSVFDFGTGTGILAILAEKLGAKNVVAIDNDEWSYQNAVENAERNSCSKISIKIGSIETIVTNRFDVVLANINRHILLEYMGDIYTATKPNGFVLMSGLLEVDEDTIVETALNQGFVLEGKNTDSGWIVLKFFRR
ncbi:MAG TPA: 50S ribosomal protein L11 methyltransferase [Flavipsychrobacter sp.]|nr:50S ribosomal protein L11 methyltransferase [Flavipsychrobacter sp.]